ncbi:MAG: Ig-like domain-containing protein, partial [Candidatus Thermoplasmatota archaeon]|nr:Ig-like domain-containing protein [Candidatus Thermoplasmatota archaeon]
DSSILHFHEYLHVSVNSEYLGPVELATVSIEDGAGDLISSDMTDENGKIPVLNLELSRRYKNRTDYFGPYIINVSHSKYYGNKTTRNISSELVIDIDLKPILGIITGWVSLPDGTPVLDATLSNELVQSKTSNDGKYILSVFARTTCTMIASKEHHSKEYIPGIYVGEGMTLVLNFTLKEDESPLSVIFLESSSYKIPLNRTLIVEFPEVLDPDTVNVSTVLLFRTDGVSSIAVNRLISLGEDMRSIRISPREDLKENSWYSMILKKEIKGLNQKEVIWRDFSYQFKTDYEALMTTVPVNGAQEVMVHEPLTIELTVPIKEDTLNASTVFVMDSSGNYVNRELSMIGGNIIVLKRTANLAYDSNYTVVITPLLKDLDSQSIFSNAYSFGFRTAIEKFRPVLHINITGEEGVMLEPLAAPRINITRPGFVMDFAFEGGMILSDLLSGTYNITAYARGYENATVILFLENNYIYNQSFELKRVQEISDEGRTSVGTIIVIGVIMGMFLLSIIFLGVRRADRLVKGRTKKNIQRSGAPGMESFEYKLAPELSVSELPAREEADGGKEPKGKGTRSSHR